jgi:AraC family transcriptional regulator
MLDVLAAPNSVELLAQGHTRDPIVQHLGLALQGALVRNDPLDRLYAESLWSALSAHLLRSSTTVALPPPRDMGGLPPPKLRRVLEYIEAHLENELHLEQLASLVELSPYHFARVFKQSTGVPPHRYVTERRIERAKLLLHNSHAGIADIALAVGCASQSHLARLFRQATGLTPQSYRSQVRR